MLTPKKFHTPIPHGMLLNLENCYLTNESGVASAIKEKGGENLQSECRWLLEKETEGEFSIREARLTRPHNLALSTTLSDI